MVNPVIRQPRRIGLDPISNREIFHISLDSSTTAFDVSCLAGQQFVCLLVMDATGTPVAELRQLCSHLLNGGCAYLCTWGPGCEQVHDLMDEEIVGPNPPKTDRGCVMTTWHEDESLEDALAFLLDSGWPYDAYATKGCNAALIVTVGADDRAAQIENLSERVRTVPKTDAIRAASH